MISYAEVLFRLAHKYQTERADLMAEKAEKLKSLEKYRGSAGYATDVKACEAKFNEAAEILKAKFREEAEAVMSGMETAISKRKMVAPSDEQLRILQALKMKTGSLTRDDVDEAGEALRGCPVALSILDDLARENGYPAKYHRLGKMPTGTAAEIISGLRLQMRDFAESDRSRAGRLAAAYLNELYGTQSVARHRRTFETKDEFYSMFSGLDPEDIKAFEEATGGGSTDD